MDTVYSSEDGRRKLGTEGIPHAIFDLRGRAVLARWGLHRNQLFAVNRLYDRQHNQGTGKTFNYLRKENIRCKTRPQP